MQLYADAVARKRFLVLNLIERVMWGDESDGLGKHTRSSVRRRLLFQRQWSGWEGGMREEGGGEGGVSCLD